MSLSDYFEVTGTINFDTALALRENGNRWIESKENIIFDFQAVDQCNSVGLAVMIAWMRQAKKLKKTIHFINIPLSLQRIAAVCGVVEILGMQ